MSALQDKTMLIVSRDRGIARAVAPAVSRDGGRVVAAGLHLDDLAEANRGADFGIEHADVAEEPSTAALTAPTSCLLTGVSNPAHGGKRLVPAKASVRYESHPSPHPLPGRAAVTGAIAEVDDGLPERECGPG